MPLLSTLLSVVYPRTQAALPCPCECSRFKESGATLYHCAVLQEVWLTAHSQHSLGFLCQVTASCVYFLCFLSSSPHRYFLTSTKIKKKKGWHCLYGYIDHCVFISSEVYLYLHEGFGLVRPANWHCFQFSSLLLADSRNFFLTKSKKTPINFKLSSPINGHCLWKISLLQLKKRLKERL